MMDIHEGGDVGHGEVAAEIFPGSNFCGKPRIVFEDYIFGLERGALLFLASRGIGTRWLAAEHESANRHEENFIGFKF